jgi:hypothetical protein
MKLALAAIALCFLMPPAAFAKCGTAQLDGNWLVLLVGSEVDKSVGKAVIAAGIVTITEPAGATYVISQTLNCRITLTNGAVTMSGSSESIAKSADVKPRLFDVGAPGASNALSFVRL